MTFIELQEMGIILKNETRKFFRNRLTFTLDEVWSFECMVAGMLFSRYGKTSWQFNEFYQFVANSIEKEVMRITQKISKRY